MEKAWGGMKGSNFQLISNTFALLLIGFVYLDLMIAFDLFRLFEVSESMLDFDFSKL